MTKRSKGALGWLMVLMLAAATPALADSHGSQGKGKGKTEAAGKSATGPSAESRAEMAAAHEKMAACLRSTRPIGECHAEMKKNHHHGDHGCDCSGCDHGKGECSAKGGEHGSCEGGHGKGHGEHHGSHHGQSTNKGGQTPAAPPTTSGPTQ